ncbi:MAG TPA: SAM-dependent chlorinase/fluorinase [Pseudonocardiaceae bacterium]|nr:SAM-dependent chlorinase/fluorinase [Pseudonocardiaceae bacterium]
MRYDWISFTTDYGTSDAFVASCKGVIARIAPSVRVLDVTHEVGPQDVRRGAMLLAEAIAYLPPSVHLAVVDPGVGTARRGVVVVAGAGVLVGPDNGLLVPAAEALGGISGCFELSESRFRLPVVSATFHGRDIFAPAAAHLANGTPPSAFGAEVDPAELIRLPAPYLRAEAGLLAAEVVGVDHFGNIQLGADGQAVRTCGFTRGDPLKVHWGQLVMDAVYGRTFADVPVGGLLVHLDSAGLLAVAVNGGSAAVALGAAASVSGSAAVALGAAASVSGAAPVSGAVVSGSAERVVIRRGGGL